MRGHVGILSATLALTVFLTSLVLEHQRQGLGRGSISGSSGGVVAPLGVESALLPRPASLTGGERPAGEATADGGEIETWLAQAWSFYEAGNRDGAVEILKAAHLRDPDHPLVLAAIGPFCFAAGRYAEAETYLLRQLARCPADTESRVRLGMSQLRQRKYGSALENMRAAMVREPEDGALHFALACIYSRLADIDRALTHLELAHRYLGVSLLAHVTVPDLEGLRDTPRYQAVLAAAVRQARERPATPPATAP